MRCFLRADPIDKLFGEDEPIPDLGSYSERIAESYILQPCWYPVAAGKFDEVGKSDAELGEMIDPIDTIARVRRVFGRQRPGECWRRKIGQVVRLFNASGYLHNILLCRGEWSGLCICFRFRVIVIEHVFYMRLISLGSLLWRLDTGKTRCGPIARELIEISGQYIGELLCEFGGMIVGEGIKIVEDIEQLGPGMFGFDSF